MMMARASVVCACNPFSPKRFAPWPGKAIQPVISGARPAANAKASDKPQLLTCFASRLPWPVHRNLNGLVVRGDLRRVRRDGDCEREALA